MALNAPRAGRIRQMTHRLFDAVLHGGSTSPRRTVYRCAGCGEEITFDALAVSCRCSQECYPALAATQGVPASQHH